MSYHYLFEFVIQRFYGYGHWITSHCYEYMSCIWSLNRSKCDSLSLTKESSLSRDLLVLAVVSPYKHALLVEEVFIQRSEEEES